MKVMFMASLCRNGVLGGILIVDDTSVTYRTGKVTIPEKYRKYRIGFEEIEEIEQGRRKFLFPTVTLRLKDGESEKFIVFARRRFVTLLEIRKDRMENTIPPRG